MRTELRRHFFISYLRVGFFAIVNYRVATAILRLRRFDVCHFAATNVNVWSKLILQSKQGHADVAVLAHSFYPLKQHYS